jgi:rRNA maturation RNase YbeY
MGDLTFVFCSDEYLLVLNNKYLKHDYFTDIITFDNTEGLTVHGDLFISVERVKENSAGLGVAFKDELYRVMVHGVLHLLGYSDKSKPAKQTMTSKEDFYLSQLSF